MITHVDFEKRHSQATLTTTLFIRAIGHATMVIRESREVAQVIFNSSAELGQAWQFKVIIGTLPEGSEFDSDMQWKIVAEAKHR